MIKFDEKSHTYTYAGSEERYKKKKFVSTTTFIGWFKNKFDEEYWSLYKALKDHYLSFGEERWNKVKKSAGGWDKVVSFYKKHQSKVDAESRLIIHLKQQKYIADWGHKRKVSNIKGTGIHKDLEDDAFHAREFVGDRGKKHVVQAADFFYHKVDKVSVKSFPECIIYNLDNMLSGTVDRVDKDGIYLDIYDYKTNIEITKEPFMDQKMKVIGLPDANYYHYLLQMSIYGWMLEQFGYKVRSLNLEHLITKDRYSREVVDIVPYEMEYRPDLVEMMLLYRYDKSEIK